MIICGIVAPNSYPVPEGGQHITLTYLGDETTDAPPEFVAQLQKLCSDMAQYAAPFDVQVEAIGELGDAYVLFLEGTRLTELRENLMLDSVVTALMSATAAEQFPQFTPHMSIGYFGTGSDIPQVPTLAEPVTIIGLSLWTSSGKHDYLFDDPNGVIPVQDANTPVIEASAVYLTKLDDDGNPIGPKFLAGDSAMFTWDEDPILAAAGNWDPSLHPRGRDGKFIKKFGIIKFLDSLTGMWSYGQVVGIEKAPGTNNPSITIRPSNLSGKPTGKPDVDMPPEKIYSAPQVKAHLKVADKGVTKVGAQAGSNPGGFYDIPTKVPAPSPGETLAELKKQAAKEAKDFDLVNAISTVPELKMAYAFAGNPTSGAKFAAFKKSVLTGTYGTPANRALAAYEKAETAQKKLTLNKSVVQTATTNLAANPESAALKKNLANAKSNVELFQAGLDEAVKTLTDAGWDPQALGLVDTPQAPAVPKPKIIDEDTLDTQESYFAKNLTPKVGDKVGVATLEPGEEYLYALNYGEITEVTLGTLAGIKVKLDSGPVVSVYSGAQLIPDVFGTPKTPAPQATPDWFNSGTTHGTLTDSALDKINKAAEMGNLSPATKVWVFNTPNGSEVWARDPGASMIGMIDDNGGFDAAGLPKYDENWSSAELGQATDKETANVLAMHNGSYGDPTFTYEKGPGYGKGLPLGMAGYKIGKGEPVLVLGQPKKSQFGSGKIYGAAYFRYESETDMWREFTMKPFGGGANYVGQPKTLAQITEGINAPISVWNPLDGTTTKLNSAADWIAPGTPQLVEAAEKDSGSKTHKFYVKQAKTKTHGRNEALANALYEEAGSYVPEVDFDEEDGNIYSKIVPGKFDMNDRLAAKDKEWMKKVQSNFAVDAWLGNRDVFGMTYDNIMSTEDGTPVRIDNGGALLYRAMGAKKTDFGSAVTELEVFRQGKKSAIFGAAVMDKAAELDGAQRVLAITPERIEELVSENNMPKSLADTLKARRKYIADYYGLPLPETMQPAGSDHLTSAPLVDPLDDTKGHGMSRKWTKGYLNVLQLADIAEPGDLIKTEKGVHTLSRVDGQSGMSVKDQLSSLMLEEGGPFQLKKMNVTGARPEHNGEISTSPSFAQALLDFEWQRGDRVEVAGVLYDVEGVNRVTGTLLVSYPEGGDTLALNVYNLKGDKVVTKRWDPEAASDVMPAPSAKVGMAAAIEKELKADLVTPLPDNGPPAASKASASSGSGIGEPTKTDVKSMQLGDGTTAATGDKVISKKDGKEYVFIKPKGYSAVVYDPTDPDKKPKMKTASTLVQPDKEPVTVVGVETAKPTSSNGVVPELGMTLTAKDGKTGTITWISPDGKSLQFKEPGSNKPIKKMVSTVSIEGAASEPAQPSMVDPGTPSPGTPGIVGHTYVTSIASALQAGTYKFQSKDSLIVGKSLVWVATGDSGSPYMLERWENQPDYALFTGSGDNVAVYPHEFLTNAGVNMKMDAVPTLDTPATTYRILYQGHILTTDAANITPVGAATAKGLDGKWYYIPAWANVVVGVSGYQKPLEPAPGEMTVLSGTVKPDGVDGDMVSLNTNFTAGTKISPDGQSWFTVVSSDHISVTLTDEFGDIFVMSKFSPVKVVVEPAPAEVVDIPEVGEGTVPFKEAPQFSVVTTNEGTASVLKLGNKVYSGDYWTASVLPDETPTTVISDLANETVTIDFMQFGALTSNRVTGHVTLNGNTYQTYAAFPGADNFMHLMLQDVDTKEWVDATADMFGDDPIQFTMTGVADTMYPADSTPLVDAIYAGTPWISPNNEATSTAKLAAKFGADYKSPVDIYLTSGGQYLRIGPHSQVQSWNEETNKWEDNSQAKLLGATKVIPGKVPTLTWSFNATTNTNMVPQYQHLPIYRVTLEDGSVRTVYEKGSSYFPVTVQGNLNPQELTKKFVTMTLVYDPWGATTPAPAADGLPVFIPNGMTSPLSLPTEGKVVEFTLQDNKKAYAVKTKLEDDFWDVYGSDTNLPSILKDASVDEALSGQTLLFTAKVVYTGPKAVEPEVPEAQKFVIGGSYVVPEHAVVFEVPSTSISWVQLAETWWPIWTDTGTSAGHMVTTEDFLSTVIPEYTAKGLVFKQIHGPEFDTAQTPTVNGYKVQPGEQVVKIADTYHYLKKPGEDGWHYIFSSGNVGGSTQTYEDVIGSDNTVEWLYGKPDEDVVTTKPEGSETLPYDFVFSKDMGSAVYVDGTPIDSYNLGVAATQTSKHPIPAGARVFIAKGNPAMAVLLPDGTGYMQKFAGSMKVPLVESTKAKVLTLYTEVNLLSVAGTHVTPQAKISAADAWKDKANYTQPAGYGEIVAGSYVYHPSSGSWVQADTDATTSGEITYSKLYLPGSDEMQDAGDALTWHLPLLDEIKVFKGGPIPTPAPVAGPVPTATPDTPATPPVAVPEAIPGVTPADAAAKAAWGGEVTKTGHIPYPGMQVTGVAGLVGKVIAISKDKTKATVLKEDGTKTTRLIKALKSNVSANYIVHLGPVTPVDIPEGMAVPYDAPATVFSKVFADHHHIGGLINPHAGIKNAATVVKSATAPNGKKYARVHFTMTTEQRAKFIDFLQGTGEPPKMGTWVPGTNKSLTELAPGDVVSLRFSNSQSEWVPDKSGSTPTHKMVSEAGGVWTFEEINGGGQITTPFTKKSSSSGKEFFAPVFDWDPTVPAPVAPSGAFKGVSDHAKALGWTWEGHNYVVPKANAANGTLEANPGDSVSHSNINGVSGGAKLKMADGTFIDVVAPLPGQHSTQGLVSISIPEGGDPVAAYSAALQSLNMDHPEMTQAAVKQQVLPMLKNLLKLNMAAPDSTGNWTETKIFNELSNTIGVPVTWADIRIGVQTEQGRTEYFWSERVIDAIAAKSPWKTIVRGGGTFSKVTDVVKYGALDATTRRFLGFDPAGNCHGSDAGNNAGNGSFMSGGTAKKFSTLNVLHPGYGGGYSVYHDPRVLFTRITDYRPGPGNSDVFGKGQGNGSNAIAGLFQATSGDLWMAGGLPADTIGFIVMNDDYERDKVLKSLHADGVTHLNGRMLEEVIRTAADLNKTENPQALPPYVVQNTVNLINLPE